MYRPGRTWGWRSAEGEYNEWLHNERRYSLSGVQPGYMSGWCTYKPVAHGNGVFVAVNTLEK